MKTKKSYEQVVLLISGAVLGITLMLVAWVAVDRGILLNKNHEVAIGVGTKYTWEPWDISFEIPPGVKIGEISDTALVVNETGVLPDGDVPQMKIYLKTNTAVPAVKATYQKEDDFSSSEARINNHLVTTIHYTDSFAGPATVYLVQIDNNVMEYHLAHAAGTPGYEHDDLVVGLVLNSLKF